MGTETPPVDGPQTQPLAPGGAVEPLRPARKRPFGLYMVVALLLLSAVALALDATLIFLGDPGAPRLFRTGLLTGRAEDAVEIAGLAVGAALHLVVAVGLWRRRRWAWVATMLVLGGGLAVAILGYVRGHPQYDNMLLSVLAVFYLNQREVQGLFERRRAGEAAA